jgi:hypothetical protein
MCCGFSVVPQNYRCSLGLCSRELLDETGEVTLTSSWKEIKKLVKDDPRYSKFSSSDRVTYCYGLNISEDFHSSCNLQKCLCMVQ